MYSGIHFCIDIDLILTSDQTILNTSLSNQEKRVLMESISRSFRSSFHEVLTFILDEYSGALEIFSKETFKKGIVKRDAKYRGKGRGRGYTKESRLLLERIFEKRKTLNAKEREVVAAHCNLTPVQVRVWVCIFFST